MGGVCARQKVSERGASDVLGLHRVEKWHLGSIVRRWRA
jgi:hypothetical protein